jgi:hypothetical protein
MHLRFQGRLTAADSKRYILHPFHVPADAGQINLHFRYAPARVHKVRNLLSLTLFSPSGFRGAGHRSPAIQRVHISANQATPGYLPGPVDPGEWLVEIDAHLVLPEEPCRYWLNITTAPATELEPSFHLYDFASSTIVTNRPGWYRGDLHTHTIHSDGAWDVVALLKAACDRKLDFLALTDHNTIAGLAEMAQAAPSELLTIPGMELTTFWGHALSLGIGHWIDWRVESGRRAMSEIASEVHTDGGLFIIAHPNSIGDPYCTGCDWRYADMMPGPARVIEVWNGVWDNDDSGNEGSLATWYHWLNQGYRLVATAGTDAHGPHHYKARVGFNVVYADALSQQAILEAIARGHLYLSSGPRLELNARTSAGDEGMMGDILRGETAEFTARWEDSPRRARLRVIADGKPLLEREVMPEGEETWTLTASQIRWCGVELRDPSGRVLALTNPIFF